MKWKNLVIFLKDNTWWIMFIPVLISLSTFWFTFLEPANIVVKQTDRIIVPALDPSNPGVDLYAFEIGATFSNLGQKTGYLEDVALKVTNPTGEIESFGSIAVFDDIIDPNFTPPKLEPFIGFSINGKQSIHKDILFRQWPEKKNPNFKRIAGEYKFQIYYRLSDSNWLSIDQTHLDLNEDSLNLLTVEGNRIGAISLPTSESNDFIRTLNSSIKK